MRWITAGGLVFAAVVTTVGVVLATYLVGEDAMEPAAVTSPTATEIATPTYTTLVESQLTTAAVQPIVHTVTPTPTPQVTMPPATPCQTVLIPFPSLLPTVACIPSLP